MLVSRKQSSRRSDWLRGSPLVRSDAGSLSGAGELTEGSSLTPNLFCLLHHGSRACLCNPSPVVLRCARRVAVDGNAECCFCDWGEVRMFPVVCLWAERFYSQSSWNRFCHVRHFSWISTCIFCLYSFTILLQNVLFFYTEENNLVWYLFWNCRNC